MFGMGGLIEKAIRDNMVKTYHQLPEIVSRWEAYRAELLKENNDAGVLLAGRPPVGGDIEYLRSIMQGNSMMERNNNTSSSSLLASNGAASSPKKTAELLAAAAAVEKEAAMEEERDIQYGQSNNIMVDRYLAEATSATTADTANAPRHARRRTASELVLDAVPIETINEDSLPPTTGQSQEPRLLINHQLPAKPRHWRGFSWDSVGSQGSQCSEAPTELEERTPGSKGAYTAWKRYNRDYDVWDTYWAQIGVQAATVAQQGVLRVLQIIGAELAAVGRLAAIVLLLVLVRLHILRVDSSGFRSGIRRDKRSSLKREGEKKQRQQQQQEAPPPQMMTRRSSSRLARTSSLQATAGVEEDVSNVSSNEGMRQRNSTHRWFSRKKSATR
jgi:hypothetical protein